MPALADTSLMLALDPTLVRTDVAATRPRDAADGVNGDPRRASAELGRLGVELIVDASVAAIRDRLLNGKIELDAIQEHHPGAGRLAARRGAVLCRALCVAQPVPTVPGMPPVPDPRNVYSETAAGKFAPAVAGARERIYVPNLRSNDVYVVDPVAMKVVDRFKVGIGPQHIVPSWDLRTLWVTNNAEGRTDGSLTPIDPQTGKPGTAGGGRRPLQHVLHARRQVGHRGGRGAQAAGLPRPEDDGAAVLDRRRPAAPASTTPTSRSTAASPSSPASSRARWSRSISSSARCWATCS